MLAVVDLAQIQDRALHHATARTAPAFDNAPITVLLAVLPSPRESQVHGPRNYAQSKIRKEGRSSLHAFPSHRPLIRLAFCRQNSKIRGPVGKVRLAGRRPSEYVGDYRRTCAFGLEPISKSPEEDNEASELYEAEEVLGVVFPTDEDASLPLNPSKEALHEPASHIPA